jgi:hypothetical protein
VESLQGVATAIDLLAHRAHVELDEHVICKEVALAFAEEIRERGI